KNESLKDISKNLHALGEKSGHLQKADDIASAFDKALAQLKEITGKAKSRPQIFYCVWPQPLLTVGKGSFLNEAITTCGGENIAEAMPQAYPHYSLEKLMLSQPEIIVLPYGAHEESLLKKEP